MEVCGVECQWDDPKVGDLAPKWRSVGLGVNGMTPKWEYWPPKKRVLPDGEIWGILVKFDDLGVFEREFGAFLGRFGVWWRRVELRVVWGEFWGFWG